MPVQNASFFHVWFTPKSPLTHLFETIPIQWYHSYTTCLHQLWHEAGFVKTNGPRSCWKSIQTMYCYSFYRSRSMLKSVIHPDSSTGTSLSCRTCKPTVRIIETVYKARFWIWQPGKKIAFFPLTFIKRFSWKWSYCMQRMTITSQTGSQSSYSWTSFHLLISQKGICNFLGRLLKTSV